MSRYAILHEIQHLDPFKDHQHIVFLSSCYEFPFDTVRALEFALFRTYAVPSISELLDRSGEFDRNPQKRYDDTDIIVSEMMGWGYESERGKRALRRMNQLHSRFDIPNEDFLYVLSTFIFEPIRWNAQYGWRPMHPNEKLAFFLFWREVGKRMNISNIPVDYSEFERFNRDYEQENFRFADSNKRVGTATRELFVGWFPWFCAPMVRSAIHALMDDPLIGAFGFPKPSNYMRDLVTSTMRLRAHVLRYFPPHKYPQRRTELKRKLYPRGYRIEELGP